MTHLLIIKNHINEIKKFCDQKGINYELYNSSLDYSQLHAEKIKEKEKLRQQLIKDYQAQAKNKKLQKELKAMEAAQFEDLKDE